MMRVGAVLVVAIVIAALLAPWIVPFDPAVQELAQRLEGPSERHWFGLDELGRDILSRVLVGARVSLFVGLVVVGVSALVGMAMGSIAGTTAAGSIKSSVASWTCCSRSPACCSRLRSWPSWVQAWGTSCSRSP